MSVLYEKLAKLDFVSYEPYSGELLQLSVYKPATMPALHDAANERLDALQQIIGILSSRVAPVSITITRLRGGNIDASKLGAHDGVASFVPGTRVLARYFGYK